MNFTYKELLVAGLIGQFPHDGAAITGQFGTVPDEALIFSAHLNDPFRRCIDSKHEFLRTALRNFHIPFYQQHLDLQHDNALTKIEFDDVEAFWGIRKAHLGIVYTLHGLVDLLDGGFLRENIQTGPTEDFRCIGFPGSPEMNPKVALIIQLYTEFVADYGFSPFLKPIYPDGWEEPFNTICHDPDNGFFIPTFNGTIFLDKKPNGKGLGQFLSVVH